MRLRGWNDATLALYLGATCWCSWLVFMWEICK